MNVRACIVVCLALACAGASPAAALEQDVPANQKFVIKLQQAVRADDRTWLADHMRYPVRYYGRKDRVVRDRAAFISRYRSIFSARLKAGVLAQNPNDLFENWQGTMIGGGRIWIRDFGDDLRARYQIITINDFE
jgi:hypothetical protein